MLNINSLIITCRTKDKKPAESTDSKPQPVPGAPMMHMMTHYPHVPRKHVKSIAKNFYA